MSSLRPTLFLILAAPFIGCLAAAQQPSALPPGGGAVVRTVAPAVAQPATTGAAAPATPASTSTPDTHPPDKTVELELLSKAGCRDGKGQQKECALGDSLFVG